MIMPQELEVWYILPGIRKELASAMKSQGLKQKQIAKLLNITNAAVSQYTNGKRATEVKFDEHIKKEIEFSAKQIAEKNNLMEEMHRLMKIIKQEKILCDIHRKHSKSDLEMCEICFK